MTEETKRGRPLKFADVKQLQNKIDGYFSMCEETGIPYTVTGLALALDTTRQTLINYEDKDEFLDTIKKAKTRVENFAETKLYSGQSTGAIFALKNFGWSDKTTTAIEGGDPEKPVNMNLSVTFVKSNSDT